MIREFDGVMVGPEFLRWTKIFVHRRFVQSIQDEPPNRDGQLRRFCAIEMVGGTRYRVECGYQDAMEWWLASGDSK